MRGDRGQFRLECSQRGQACLQCRQEVRIRGQHAAILAVRPRRRVAATHRGWIRDESPAVQEATSRHNGHMGFDRPIDETALFRVCFVCTGNICRSPMAEAIFRSMITAARPRRPRSPSTSAATGDWHVGERSRPPHHRGARRPRL